MAENKVKYNLSHVHYAMLTYDDQGNPQYGTPKPIPGAVNLSLEANGEPENFYADGIAYYIINNNQGYEGDLEIALIPESFRVDALGDVKDNKGMLVESSDAQLKHFALLFEFDGDKNKLRHVFYNCVAARPSVAGQTKEESTEVQTETLTIKATPLENGYIKSKTGKDTNTTVYNNWYNAVTMPDVTFAVTPETLEIEQGESDTVTMLNKTGTVTITVEKAGVATDKVTYAVNGNVVTIAAESDADTGEYTVSFSDAGTTPASTATVSVTVTSE